jgi:hypothetical protein
MLDFPDITLGMSTYIAALCFDLLNFSVQARKQTLPTPRQGILIFIKELLLQLREARRKRFGLVVGSQTRED